MKKTIFFLLILLLAGGGLTYHFMHKPENVEPAAGGGGPLGAPQGPMPTEVMTLTQQDVQTTHDFSGRLVAIDQVAVRPRVGGAIQEIYFQPGATVEKDQPLFLIDPRPYQAALNQAQATLATARAGASLAKTESDRAKRLIKDNAISQREYTERMNAIQVSGAGIQSAEAAVQQAKLNLDYATIKSPIRGKISRAEITLGNLVDPSQNAVLTEIISLDPIYADFDVDEQTYLDSVHQSAGDTTASPPVSLILNGAADKPYAGKIVLFDNQLNTQSGTIRARAIFDNKDQTLVPGMYATIRLDSAKTVSAILVSDRYIVTDQDKKVVYVVDKDNAVQYRPVTLGGIAQGQRIILGGVQPGEKIIIQGLQKIHPGMKVVPQEKTDATAPNSDSGAPPQPDEAAKE